MIEAKNAGPGRIFTRLKLMPVPSAPEHGNTGTRERRNTGTPEHRNMGAQEQMDRPARFAADSLQVRHAARRVEYYFDESSGPTGGVDLRQVSIFSRATLAFVSRVAAPCPALTGESCVPRVCGPARLTLLSLFQAPPAMSMCLAHQAQAHPMGRVTRLHHAPRAAHRAHRADGASSDARGDFADARVLRAPEAAGDARPGHAGVWAMTAPGRLNRALRRAARARTCLDPARW